MVKIFKYCFDNWLRPILFFCVTSGFLGLCWIINNRFLDDLSFILLGLGFLSLFISIIYQFAKRHWKNGILTCLFLCGSIIGFIFYSIALFWKDQSSPDQFADDLKIPTNIQIENPADIDYDKGRPDSLTNRRVTKTDFQLYNSFQPGIYEFDFWTGNIESGMIYLKAFEITQEQALSTERLQKTSLVNIYNPTDSIMKFGSISDFTIYEGDWGKPYAARFEVWFKPNNSREERKLIEKNYKIEGWMR